MTKGSFSFSLFLEEMKMDSTMESPTPSLKNDFLK